MHDGMIKFNSDAAALLGFSPERFSASSWLWKERDAIIISFIESREKGNFRQLVERIQELGYAVEIPTPLERMREIVRKNGYRREIRNDEQLGPVEVWRLDATIQKEVGT